MKRTRGRRVAIWVAGLAVVVLGVATRQGWPHMVFWWQLEPLGLNAQGFPEYRPRTTGTVFVRLPGGTFWMGAEADDLSGHNFEAHAVRNESPVHEVTLSPFLMATFELRRAEWGRVMASHPSVFQGADRPVEYVGWEDCQEFCRKTGLRLPTEAEWECACRAETKIPFAFGETLTTVHGDYDGTYPYGSGPKGEHCEWTVLVSSFRPNALRFYELDGSVWEWCEDVYDDDFYSHAMASGKDFICESGSGYRVVRGGWLGGARSCPSAVRNRDRPENRVRLIGCRTSRSWR